MIPPKRAKHSLILPWFFSHSNDTQNSTTSTSYVQSDPRSMYMDFDEVEMPAGMRLQMRWIVAFRTTDADYPAWARLTHEAYTGATPASGTLWELSTTVTSFGDENSVHFTDWLDVTDWTGKHEFNTSFRTEGATAYLQQSALQFRYVREV